MCFNHPFSFYLKECRTITKQSFLVKYQSSYLQIRPTIFLVGWHIPYSKWCYISRLPRIKLQMYGNNCSIFLYRHIIHPSLMHCLNRQKLPIPKDQNRLNVLKIRENVIIGKYGRILAMFTDLTTPGISHKKKRRKMSKG